MAFSCHELFHSLCFACDLFESHCFVPFKCVRTSRFEEWHWRILVHRFHLLVLDRSVGQRLRIRAWWLWDEELMFCPFSGQLLSVHSAYINSWGAVRALLQNMSLSFHWKRPVALVYNDQVFIGPCWYPWIWWSSWASLNHWCACCRQIVNVCWIFLLDFIADGDFDTFWISCTWRTFINILLDWFLLHRHFINRITYFGRVCDQALACNVLVDHIRDRLKLQREILLSQSVQFPLFHISMHC